MGTLRSITLLLALGLVGCPEGGDKASDTTSAEDGAKSKKKKKKKKTDAGEPADTGGETKPPAVSGGGETPQAAFDKLQKAAKEDDYKTLFTTLTREPQNTMLTGMLLGAAITLAPMGTKPNPDKQKELDAILKKHGLEDTKMQGQTNPQTMMAEMAKRLDTVKDRPALFDELMGFLNKNSLTKNRFELLSMEDLKISGDSATAVVVMKDKTGKTKRDPVELKKIDGRWYFHVLNWK